MAALPKPWKQRLHGRQLLLGRHRLQLLALALAGGLQRHHGCAVDVHDAHVEAHVLDLFAGGGDAADALPELHVDGLRMLHRCASSMRRSSMVRSMPAPGACGVSPRTRAMRSWPLPNQSLSGCVAGARTG
jgi:hypothetical protein